jgi:hypothetical protein
MARVTPLLTQAAAESSIVATGEFSSSETLLSDEQISSTSWIHLVTTLRASSASNA